MIKISTHDLPENATMAHVAAKSGAFPSTTQARKNGWDGPVTLGTHRITKKITVEVIDRPLTEGDLRPRDTTYRPDLEPGFWPNYEEPRSRLSWAIQFPLNSPNWQERVINAYSQDSIRARKRAVDVPGDR